MTLREAARDLMLDVWAGSIAVALVMYLAYLAAAGVLNEYTTLHAEGVMDAERVVNAGSLVRWP